MADPSERRQELSRKELDEHVTKADGATAGDWDESLDDLLRFAWTSKSAQDD